jgi:hypothetical protein
MEITKWFDCGADGRPMIPGWYEWELHLNDERASCGAVILTMAPYTPKLDFVLLNGRAVAIMDCDQWRGVVPNVK